MTDEHGPGDARGGIHPATALGPVRLVAGDADTLGRFYASVLGLVPAAGDGDAVALGVPGEAPIVELVPRPGAPPRPRPSTGLFHLAVLVPGRAELARAIRRALRAGWELDGAADHLVSEAVYMRDPEGNGIEVYRDRPREEWPLREGRIRMDTLPLDVDGVLGALPRGAGDEGMAPGTRIGHVHLSVRDLPEAGRFYRDALGFGVTVDDYPGALFVSAGGYHHHVGLNTWGTAGAPAPAPGSRGLDRFDVLVPDDAALTAVAEGLAAAGAPAEDDGGSLVTADPSGNRLRVRASGPVA